MNEHLSSAGLKSRAKGQLLGNYSTVVGVTAVYGAFSILLSLTVSVMLDTRSLLGFFLYQAAAYLVNLITGMLSFGLSFLYLKLSCGQPIFVRDLFYGFSYNSVKVLRIEAVLAGIAFVCYFPANLLMELQPQNSVNAYLLLAEAVLLIGGIAVSFWSQLTFSQSHYLLLDFPGYSPREILRLSHKLMQGNKGRLFYIYLSFVPLYLLALVGCYLPLLWILPYFQAVLANFYLDLVRKSGPVSN